MGKQIDEERCFSLVEASGEVFALILALAPQAIISLLKRCYLR